MTLITSFKYFLNEAISQKFKGWSLSGLGLAIWQRIAYSSQIQTLKAKIQETKGLPADTLKIVFKGKTVNN
jgi:hypothetical protein